MRPSGTRSAWWAAALVALCVALAFQPTFDAEFLNFDDDLNITENHAFRGLDAEHLSWMFTTNWMGPYQPLSWLSLAADHALWGLSGPREFPEAPYFHRTNVLLHALTAAAFVFLARALFRAVPGLPSGSRAVAAASGSALFFGLHPLRVESVAWVTERRDVLSGLFIVLALLAWLRYLRLSDPGARDANPPARPWRPGRAWGTAAAGSLALAAFWVSVDLSGATALAWRGPGAPGLLIGVAALALAVHLAAAAGARGAYSLTLVLFLLALLSKGLVVVFPVVLLVLDAWPARRLTRASARDRVLEKAPFFALALAFGLIAIWGQAAQAGTLVGLAEHGPLERLAQAAFGLLRYPLATLLPLGLRPIYELPETLSLAQPRFALAALGVLLLSATLWRLRARMPAALAAWVAFAVIIAPVLGLTQSGPQLVADRYTYLACMPFALLAGGAWLAARVRPAVSVLALLALVGYAQATWRYAHAWRSSTALWEYTLERDPDGLAARINHATALGRAAESERDPVRREQLLREVVELLERGLELRVDPRLLGNLGRIHAALGERERALEYSGRALELARAEGVLVSNYHFAYGLDLLGLRRAEEALVAFDVVLGAEPTHFGALAASGRALSSLGRHGAAAERFERAVALEPRSVPLWRRVALARDAAGDADGARRAWRRVLALEPQHAGARERLLEAVESGR